MRDLRGGVLVIDKRPGLTSHDVVHVVRRALKGPKLGHTGTLDPMATGVLALVVGRATRLAQFFSGEDKEYVSRFRLGAATDTYDAAGVVTFRRPDGAAMPDRAAVERALEGLSGTRSQLPPPYSAKKAGGIPAYERARRGESVVLAPAEVTAYALDVLGFEDDVLEVRIRCSAGYYVRSLAHDLGAALGVGGHVVDLRRIRSGSFRIEDAVDLELVLTDPEAGLARLVPLEALLPEIPAIRLSAEGEQRVRHGLPVGPAHTADGGAALPARARLLDGSGQLVALADRQAGGFLHPGLVLG